MENVCNGIYCVLGIGVGTEGRDRDRGSDDWVGSGVGGTVDLVGLRADHTIGIAMGLVMLALGDNPEHYPQRPQARGPQKISGRDLVPSAKSRFFSTRARFSFAMATFFWAEVFSTRARFFLRVQDFIWRWRDFPGARFFLASRPTTFFWRVRHFFGEYGMILLGHHIISGRGVLYLVIHFFFT